MSKKLVAYFSASGNTAVTAKKLAEASKADIYEISPAVAYTEDDLDWKDKTSRSSVEMTNKNSRPAMADKEISIADYDTIYIGFPVWWYIAPTIVNTFLEKYDFSGKKIILFATAGGSTSFGKTIENLKVSAPNAEFIEGYINPSESEITALANL